MTNYNKTKIYDEQISKHMEAIKSICGKNNLPFFATFCIENNENKSIYITEGVPTGSRQIELKDDRIVKHLCIQNGFDVVPSAPKIDLNF